MKILLLILFSFAGLTQAVKVQEVIVECQSSQNCYSKENLMSLKGSFESSQHLKEIITIIAQADGVKNIDYQLKEGVLRIQVDNYALIGDIEVKLHGEDYGEDLILPISTGDFFYPKVKTRTIDYLSDYFTAKGYEQVEVSSSNFKKDKRIKLVFNVSYAFRRDIQKIDITCLNEKVKAKAQVHFDDFINEPFESKSFGNSVEELRNTLLDSGYYFIDISWKERDVKRDAIIEVSIKNTERQAFYLKGLRSELRNTIKSDLVNSARVYRRVLNKDLIQDAVKSILFKNGLVAEETVVTQFNRLNTDNLFISMITVKGTKPIKVKEIVYRGNHLVSEAKLDELFWEEATGKVKADILSEDYYLKFVERLKRHYIQLGLPYIDVKGPSYTYLDTAQVQVVFKINEGVPVTISEFNIKGMPPKLMQKVKQDIFLTQEGRRFNPLEFEEDLQKLKRFMWDKGYYFFKIENEDDSSIVVYNDAMSSVAINVSVETGEVRHFNSLLILGNRKTKDALFLKYLKIYPDELITRTKLKEYQSQLLGLGIFSSVVIETLKLSGGATDLVVVVKERDFGAIEIAPGVRSDLGPKFSAAISYNNLGGMNRFISLQAQVNQRFDLKTLAPERRDDTEFLEYDVEIDYNENKIFDTNWDFGLGLIKSKRRLYQFDANIQRISQTVSNQLTDWFKFFITYQLEYISQFNSTQERESGKFEVGSLTPTFTLDFRNNRINPTSGTYFNLSYERASPFLRSQNDDELKVDYYKTVLRNFFYIPFNRGTLAISLAGGVQKNLNEDLVNSNGEVIGYIPNIKVFRLSGMDIVRGYDDEEINRVISGRDISEELITDKAYMVNFKFEPRYFVNDNFITGVFFDAGRIYVDDLRLGELRSSYGLTFKYLTPVGTLDLDYGIKTLRKRQANGKLESPGRIHLSIGFF